MYCAYITTLTNLHKHSNADRLLIGECFGNNVIVSLDYTEGQIGVYFPSDGQLSTEFAEANNLVRKKDENGKNIGGYLDPNKRNITAIKLRGEKSDGLFLPLTCLEPFGDINKLTVGDKIDVFNGHEICTKYIPRGTNSNHSGEKVHNKVKHKEKKINVAPLFEEHIDTEQLQYNLSAFKLGDEIEISIKMHGTSQRTGYLPTLKGFKRTLWDRITHRQGTPIYDWGYVSGTRRTVLKTYDGGYYGSDKFREAHAKAFEGKLNKGETVYYEVVGYTNDGVPIMPTVSNLKTNDEEFIRQYGAYTEFSYGCSPVSKITKVEIGDDGKFHNTTEEVIQSDCYVYRMTMTNEDGDVVEYSPDYIRYRCAQMGVKTVLQVAHEFIPMDVENAGEYVLNRAKEYYDGPDPVGKTHIREGVVVRIVNRPTFTAYKIKNFNFKVIEGIAKTEETSPDLEEAQEVFEETNEN